MPVKFKSFPGKRIAGVNGITLVFPASGIYETENCDEVARLICANDVTHEGLDEFMAKPLAVVYDTGNFGSAIVGALPSRGYRVLRRDPKTWKGEIEQAAIVFAKGRRRDELREAYSGTPFFVFDWGYLDRVNEPTEHFTGHWQLSADRLNNIPAGPVPADRFDALGIDVKTRSGDKEGYILLIGQMPGDSAHSGRDHKAWLMEQVEQHGAENIIYRPHPRGGVTLEGVTTMQGGALSQALMGARLVVCFNSNSGHDALLAGVPVVCDPCAAYAELSGDKLPSAKRRRAYFERVAYGQWKISEVDQALDFVLGGLNADS